MRRGRGRHRIGTLPEEEGAQRGLDVEVLQEVVHRARQSGMNETEVLADGISSIHCFVMRDGSFAFACFILSECSL